MRAFVRSVSHVKVLVASLFGFFLKVCVHHCGKHRARAEFRTEFQIEEAKAQYTCAFNAGRIQLTPLGLGTFACETPVALPIEKSTPGFANLRVRAPPHVHPRGLGSRPSSLRGLNEEFY